MRIDSTIAAIVTGGASGLGAASAKALAARGARVALFDTNAEAGEEIARQIGGVFCPVDVTDDAAVVAGFAEARAAHGQERVLIQCAGIAPAAKSVSRDKATGAARLHPIALFERALAINLTGSFRCILHAAAGMMDLAPLDAAGQRGVIITTASVAAEDGQIGQAAYAASKAGVVGMTLPLARDLMNEGVRVNTILPGIFETPLLRGLPEPAQAALATMVPFPKRLGQPAEFAALALAMIENDYMNGAAIRLDGAIRMAPR